ncbi:hypothetical protein [Tsukamurella spumae]|uniref:Uncharacterized protein n=1 Tax=Tsukamurella spumae TaxID=44753 RepID=A0A846X2U5_9ACTN|nr:hypothetical protein [Tsukamurella spumae]NKY18886.1 hypothetical protein [Tsukamurella spumae]
MEKGAPLEHNDPRRERGIQKLQRYVLFEHFMQDVDSGHVSRDDAIASLTALNLITPRGEPE